MTFLQYSVYIKAAPCGRLFRRAHGYELSAVFFLTIVKSGDHQNYTRGQHDRNPEGNIAVIAGLNIAGVFCQDWNSRIFL